jgi:hypothetical protein
MRILVYKQTHLGDPNQRGEWRHCTGKRRLWNYYAVIGIGGIGHEPKSWGIDRKVTWIGIGPAVRRNIVRFEHFRNFGNNGPTLASVASGLAKRLFRKKYTRFFLADDDPEIQKLLECAEDAPPSRDYDGYDSPSAC